MADGDNEIEEPTKKTAKLEEENVETNIEHVMADIQATDTGQNQELAFYSSLNDVQGTTPRKPKDTEMISDFIPAKYLNDPSQSDLKFTTAGFLRKYPYLFKNYQAIITCDLQKVLDKGIYVYAQHAFETIRKTVEDDKNSPFVDDDFEGAFVGNTEIVEQVATRVNEILQRKDLQGHDTFAFVHTGPNGVGKTFTAMSLPELLQNSTMFAGKDLRFVYAYIGFNVQMPFKNLELALIERGEVKDQIISLEERIDRVVLSRLILVLRLMIKHNEIYDTNYLHAQPMMPIDLKKLTPYDDCLKLLHELDSRILQEEVNSLCSELTKEIGKSTVIVVNLDEAQILDELVKVEDTPQGARLALRMLRQMQKKTFNHQKGGCLLLPIASGIRPATTPNINEKGRNLGVLSPILSKNDFAKVAEKYLKDMDKKKRLLVTTLQYPRVRALKNFMGEVHPVNSDEDCTYEDLQKVLAAGFGGVRAERSMIPQLIATRDSFSTDGVPILDVGVWPWILRQLVASGRGTNLKLPILLPLDIIGKGLNCYDFQRTAFDVLVFTLIFLGKFQWTSDILRYKYLKLSDFYNIFDVDVGGAFGPRSYMVVEAEPSDTLRYYLPLSVRGSHKEAYNSPLHESFVTAIKDLQVGQSLLYSCGISKCAMVDYIYVCQVAESTEDTNVRLVLRYGKSKHSKTGDPVSDHKIEKLQKKTYDLHAAITNQFHHDLGPKEYIVSADYKIFIITNVHRWHEGVYFLSPKTFKFEPWTNILFEVPFSDT